MKMKIVPTVVVIVAWIGATGVAPVLASESHEEINTTNALSLLFGGGCDPNDHNPSDDVSKLPERAFTYLSTNRADREEIVSELMARIGNPTNLAGGWYFPSLAIRLLGEFKAVEAAPALARIIGFPHTKYWGVGTLGIWSGYLNGWSHERFEDEFPAVGALIKMGESGYDAVIARVTASQLPLPAAVTGADDDFYRFGPSNLNGAPPVGLTDFHEEMACYRVIQALGKISDAVKRIDAVLATERQPIDQRLQLLRFRHVLLSWDAPSSQWKWPTVMTSFTDEAMHNARKAYPTPSDYRWKPWWNP